MTRNCQRPEGAQITTIFQRDEAERDDDKQNGFFVYVPAEEEGGITAECQGCDKVCPGWAEEQFDQGGLKKLVYVLRRNWVGLLTI